MTARVDMMRRVLISVVLVAAIAADFVTLSPVSTVGGWMYDASHAQLPIGKPSLGSRVLPVVQVVVGTDGVLVEHPLRGIVERDGDPFPTQWRMMGFVIGTTRHGWLHLVTTRRTAALIFHAAHNFSGPHPPSDMSPEERSARDTAIEALVARGELTAEQGQRIRTGSSWTEDRWSTAGVTRTIISCGLLGALLYSLGWVRRLPAPIVSRRRRRAGLCGRCAYDLNSLHAMTSASVKCPECGTINPGKPQMAGA